MKKIISVLLLVVMVCAVALPSFATEASFTVFSDEEFDYYYFDLGSSNSGGARFHDGWNYIIYEFPIAETDTHAQLSWHIRNQYQVSVSITDPDDTDTFEVIHEAVPTDAELAEGKANWGDYGSDFITVHDLSKFCENNTTGKIWVMMADADPTNGWGGYIYNDTPVTFWSGSTEAPTVEQPKTKDDLAAETLAKYTFPEGSQYFICTSATEAPFIYAQSGSNIDGGFNRFNDATGYVIYQFDVKAADTAAWLHIALNNQYDVRVATSDPDNIDGYTQVLVAEQTEDEIASGSPSWGHRVYNEDTLDEEGNVISSKTVIPVFDLDLTSYLTGKDGKIYVWIGDIAPDAGWGGQIRFEEPVVFTTNGKFESGAAAEAPAVEEAAPAAFEIIEATLGAADNKEKAENLFDNDESTKWCVNASDTASVTWKVAEPVSVVGYEIVTANDNASNPGRNPCDWTFYGSNDGVEWTVIDAVEGDSVLQNVNYTPYTFDAAAPGTYSYFKFDIAKYTSGSVMQMSGLNLIEGEIVAEEVVEEVVETPVVEEVVETPVVEAPQTFDAAVIAVLAVVTALGGAVVSKKRH